MGLYFGGLPARGWLAIVVDRGRPGGGGWFLLKDYQKARIGTFLNPDSDVLGSGCQDRQSKIAVGSGGFSGKGFRSGAQSQLRFLPVQHTDFILAVIGGSGSLGVTLVLGLFRGLFLRALKLRADGPRPWRRFPDPGLTGMMFFSVVVNASMMIGLRRRPESRCPSCRTAARRSRRPSCRIGLILGVDYRRFANA